MAETYYGTGRRKTSVARVYLRPGSGKIVVNRRDFDEYFPNQVLKMVIRQPLLLTETADKFDILVNVQGGGPTGQAGAIRHGISRALLEYNGELRPQLKAVGFLAGTLVCYGMAGAIGENEELKDGARQAGSGLFALAGVGLHGMSRRDWRRAKQLGFADAQLALLDAAEVQGSGEPHAGLEERRDRDRHVGRRGQREREDETGEIQGHR